MRISGEKLEKIAAGRGGYSYATVEEMARELRQLRASHEELVKALSVTVGYMHNAAIDLVTGAKKSVAKNTLDGGIIRAEEALANAQKVREG